MIQLKPPTTYNQQVEKMRSRGCIITDEPFCIKVLSQINYYRLTAYFLPFKKPDGNYLPGTDFNTIYQIYEFDRHLRNLLFAAIEEVEIYLRAEFSYYHAHKYNATGYMDSANYNNKHNHNAFMGKINTEISQNSNALFVKHHLNNYGGQFPIWVITELFTFGMLSYFYADLLTLDQKNWPERCTVLYPKISLAGLGVVPIYEIFVPIMGGYIFVFLPLSRLSCQDPPQTQPGVYLEPSWR